MRFRRDNRHLVAALAERNAASARAAAFKAEVDRLEAELFLLVGEPDKWAAELAEDNHSLLRRELMVRGFTLDRAKPRQVVVTPGSYSAFDATGNRLTASTGPELIERANQSLTRRRRRAGA